MPFFLAILSLGPLLEIIAFIFAAGEFGFFTALFMLFVSAAVGVIIIRYQGFSTIFAVQHAARTGKMPATTLFDTICVVVAGLLLILPGFISDAIAIALLIPRMRNALLSYLKANTDLIVDIEETAFEGRRRQGSAGDVIEGEFERVEDDRRK